MPNFEPCPAALGDLGAFCWYTKNFSLTVTSAVAYRSSTQSRSCTYTHLENASLHLLTTELPEYKLTLIK